MTNTNWQAYGGETTMSYLTQMVALTFQNFVSAAVGMAVLIAMIRGFTRAGTDDARQLLARHWSAASSTSCCRSRSLVADRADDPGRGADARRLGDRVTGIQGFEQMIARGPVASQIAIKQLGTNGGGFFNVNSAHPFENATPARELPRAVRDPVDPRGAHLHVRQDGRAASGRAGRSSPRCGS